MFQTDVKLSFLEQFFLSLHVSNQSVYVRYIFNVCTKTCKGFYIFYSIAHEGLKFNTIYPTDCINVNSMSIRQYI